MQFVVSIRELIQIYSGKMNCWHANKLVLFIYLFLTGNLNERKDVLSVFKLFSFFYSQKIKIKP